MTYEEVRKLFAATIPTADRSHMLSYFSHHADQKIIQPFTHGLFVALAEIEAACSGYAQEMIRRIAKIEGTGTEPFQAIVQVLAEIYVTQGAVAVADINDSGVIAFNHEPRIGKGKNPEFESQSHGIWYSVEVKAPGLVVHARERASRGLQFLTRLGKDIFDPELVVQPRDNPIKDFLKSANDKFAEYSLIRPEAYRVLTIVWDDAVQEPISALTNSISGLLTPNSFYKNAEGQAIQFPFIDGVVVCRYQNQIYNTLTEKPLDYDDILPLRYRNDGLPFKAFLRNPHGREVPDSLRDSLNAIIITDTIFAEYQPIDGIFWFRR